MENNDPLREWISNQLGALNLDELEIVKAQVVQFLSDAGLEVPDMEEAVKE